MFNIERLRTEVERVNLLYVFDHAAHRKDCCIYCGKQFLAQPQCRKKTRDHIIPRARLSEASHHFKSVFFQFLTVHCCRGCNELKDKMSLLEFRTHLASSTHESRELILHHLDKMIQD